MQKPIIIDNFIDAKDAADLIEEMKNPSEVNQYPEYYKKRFGGTSLPYNKNVINLMKKYAIKSNLVHQKLNPKENKDIKTFKGFGSWWKPGSYGSLHIDDQNPEPFIEYSTVIYLNDEFEGGKIFFPKKLFEYQPKKYSAVFFKSEGAEWIHGISPVENGERYVLLYMHTTNLDEVDPDLDWGDSMNNEEKLQQELNFMYQKYEELCKSYKKMMEYFSDSTLEDSVNSYKNTFFW